MKVPYVISIFLIFLLIGIISCKKEEHHWEEIKDTPVHNWGNNDTTSTGDPDTTNTSGNPDTNIVTPPTVVSDSIIFVDIPDFTIKSVYSYSPTPFCTKPMPEDTSVYANLDIDNDGSADVFLNCETNYNQTSASNPCANYEYFILCGTSASDGVVTMSNGMSDSLSYGTVISSNSIFQPGGSAIRVSTQSSFGFSFIQQKDIYIGIKLLRNGQTHYGWVLVNLPGDNGLTIKSYALNRTPGNDIYAGQAQ